MDIVIRSLVVFAFLWLVIRVGGKREVGQLSPFDLILLVTVGDLVSQGVVQEDYSLTAAVLAVSTFTVAALVLAWVGFRFPRTRPVLTGTPRVAVRGGDVDLRVLTDERLTLDDLNEAARQRGIRSLREIELGVLETDGTFSFFTAGDRDPRRDPRRDAPDEDPVT